MDLKHFSRTLVLLVFALFLAGCATAPLDFPKSHSKAIAATSETYLGKQVAGWTAEHPGKSGFYPLVGGLDALGVRLAMIDRAERSIDAQYFLLNQHPNF